MIAIDKRIRDLSFPIRGPQPADPRIVIIDIDEKSLEEVGQWPWPRNKFATLLQNLSDAGASVIGLDIVFAEPDNTSPRKIAREASLDIPEGLLEDYDDTLAETLARTPTITSIAFRFDEKGSGEDLFVTIPGLYIEKNLSENSYMLVPKKAIPNIPVLQDASHSTGYFNTISDKDGVVRSVPLVLKYQDEVYPLISFEMFRTYKEIEKVFINHTPNGISDITLADTHIPTDRHGRLFVNYRGPANTYTYLSASDIYHKRFDPALMKENIILVGTSAIGLFDIRTTPFDNAFPGIEVHANVIDNLLNRDFIYKPSWAESADLVIIFALALLTALTLIGGRPMRMIAVGILSVIFVSVSSYHALVSYGIVLSILFPMLTIIMVFMASLLLNYFLEIKQKHLLREKLIKKVSVNVMEDLLNNPDSNLLAAKEAEVTVYFSDIKNFTTHSEKIGSPTKLLRQLNDFFEPMTKIIIDYNGTIDKFIGDSIMAYWNAPKAIDGHQDLAVEAALKQLETLKRISADFISRGIEPFEIRIGINSGTATVGEIGSSGRADYTIIGDCVNTASRLEGANKLYGSDIIISESTFKSLRKEYVIRDLDYIQLKGKSELTHIYEVIGFAPPSPALQDELDEYHTALGLFRDERFDEAEKMFGQLNTNKPHPLYALYRERASERNKGA